MAAFSYLALTPQGKQSKGVLEGDSTRQIRQQLREQQLTPLEVKPLVNDNTATPAKRLSRSPKLSVADLAMLTRQLATLVQASLPLEEALNTVAKQSERAKVRGIILSVRSKVLEGHNLASSMAEFPNAFPALFRATIAAGEHAGHLDLVLNKLADYCENSYASRQKAMLALLYPILLFIMAVAIVAGLMAFVVPDVVEVFVGQGQALPALTSGLIACSNFVVDYGLFMLVALIAAIIAFKAALNNAGFRLWVDKQLLHLPLLGRLTRGGNCARYASTLSILTTSGVPLVEAMQIAAQVMANSFLKQRVVAAAQQVREGGSLHRALEQCGYFPPMMVHMIASGELSGELDTMLGRVAEHQQKELDNLIATLVGFFEPAMLLFMGCAVLLIVVAILQPIFDLNTLI
ncbi:type II secretion system inner membrane protein GspF [Dasania sp. GY-MA-18]|uniref:General secretion pathway protein F n=1 Tax=Dasania phycosphaerae TaxID=2950436 RepID=A0A9J6RJ43_9GAMM|nr:MULTISPECIES: type II secretion system inner membrane protein GspF [Dasania]MCR8921795.1 type II secretion system inner membrane protein GspF [Dasania sp. GY-MA-18]MCZ0864223.1 type II secretion system inner membrane protein GspF [Dasania phycosphaerae]MCZ0867951.1 type II secretion system inner membrane protein GspF [Dasania phycosphaerae]